MKRKASMFCPDNYIVAAGWKIRGDKQCSYDYNDKPCKYNLRIPEHVTILVGFNLKFDLLWQWDNPDLKAFFKRGGRIWDCQYAEYLLKGMDQRYHYPSLTETAPRYGGTTKIDEVKILWEAGVQTSDINKDLLIDYLIGTEEEGRDGGDIGNTEKVFLGQLQACKDVKDSTGQDIIKAIWSRMDGLCATTEMEWNGLKIDIAEARAQYLELNERRTKAYTELQEYVNKLPEGLEFKWTSVYHKSSLIFGGTVKYQKRDTYIDDKTGELARKVKTEKWPLFDGSPVDVTTVQLRSDGLYYDQSGASQDVFKGGKQKGLGKFKNVKVPGDLKTKLQDFYYTFPGFTVPLPEWQGKQTDAAGKPIYRTGAEIILSLSGRGVPFCDILVEYTELNKEISTYFVDTDKGGNKVGMLTCVEPDTHIIHHSLNNCATVTARLSSSDPNLQNIPRGDKSNVKKIFTSRYGEDGFMLEADYSQLEVVVQGVLSRDKQLCEDLRNKIDFHCKRVAIQPDNKITYDEVKAIIDDEDHPDHKFWKVKRTGAKNFSFQRAYGAGAAAIAHSLNMDVDTIKDMITAEEATYPGVVAFNNEVERKVSASGVPFRDPVNNYRVYRRGHWRSPTGCLYTWRSWDAPKFMQERGVMDTFKPTELKNYPVQGTGGEIVQGICGRLWRHFVQNDNYGGKALLVNTVHDCVWADSHADVADDVASDIKRIMEAVDDWFDQFGVKITVPFPVEVERGPNMLELTHVL